MATSDPPIRPAATTACLRQGKGGVEVLLVRRSRGLVFYGSAWAFPGGRVDSEDASPGADLYDQSAGRNAAVRETHEETSITLLWLGGFNTVDAALSAAQAQPLERFVPRVATLGHVTVSLYQGDAGYATCDPKAVGPRHRLWMKPDGWNYERA